MKKIKLRIEELRVDSFGTTSWSKEKGTVAAHYDESIVVCGPGPTEVGDTCPICRPAVGTETAPAPCDCWPAPY